MLGTVRHAPWDVRSEIVPEPRIIHPADAIIRLSASCVRGSDLRPYRGVVVAVGDAVSTVKPGQFVVGSFCLSDNTRPHCRFGFPSSLSEAARLGRWGFSRQSEWARAGSSCFFRPFGKSAA